MSVRLAKLVVGKATPEPTLSMWLEQCSDVVALMARHSDDKHDQTLLEIGYHPTTGVLEVRVRDIHAERLCELLNVAPFGHIKARFVDKSQ